MIFAYNVKFKHSYTLIYKARARIWAFKNAHSRFFAKNAFFLKNTVWNYTLFCNPVNKFCDGTLFAYARASRSNRPALRWWRIFASFKNLFPF